MNRTLLSTLTLATLAVTAWAQSDDDEDAQRRADLERLRAQIERLHAEQARMAEHARELMNRADEMVRELHQKDGERHERRSGDGDRGHRLRPHDQGDRDEQGHTERDGHDPDPSEHRDAPGRDHIRREKRNSYRIETRIGPDGKQVTRAWRNGDEIDPDEIDRDDFSFEFDLDGDLGWNIDPRWGQDMEERMKSLRRRFDMNHDAWGDWEAWGDWGHRFGDRIRRNMERRFGARERGDESHEHRRGLGPDDLDSFLGELEGFLEEMPWEELGGELEHFFDRLEDRFEDRFDHPRREELEDDDDDDHERVWRNRRTRGRWF